jgi:hypothetical protein
MDITSDKSKYLKQVGTYIDARANKIKEVSNSTLNFSERSVDKIQNFFNLHYVFILFVLLCAFTYFLYNYFLNNSAKKIITNYVDLSNKGFNVTLDNLNSESSAYNMSIYFNTVVSKCTLFQLNKNSSFTGYTNDGYINNGGICALYIEEPGSNLIFCLTDTSYNIMSPFPKETWTNIHINIFNIYNKESRVFEFYINGKLTKTYSSSKTTIDQPTNNLKMRIGGDGGSDKGNVIINNFTRWPYTLNHPNVWEIYKTFNDDTKYDIKINVKSESDVDDNIYKSINLFAPSKNTDSTLLL